MKTSHQFFTRPPEIFMGKIPFIVSDLIEELIRRKSDTFEGIFRLNGSDTKVRQLIEKFENGHVSDIQEIRDIHTISTTLKRYFRNMLNTKPLISDEVFEKLLELLKDEGGEEVFDNFRENLLSLGQTRFNLLNYLASYLRKVADNERVNQMNPSNLAICFAPNLFMSTEGNSNRSFQANSVTSYLISNYKAIFGECKLEPEVFCTDKDILSAVSCPYSEFMLYQMIMRTHRRQQSVIPYMSNIQINPTGEFRRPTREPPKIENTFSYNGEVYEEVSDYDFVTDSDGEEKGYTYVWCTDSDAENETVA